MANITKKDCVKILADTTELSDKEAEDVVSNVLEEKKRLEAELNMPVSMQKLADSLSGKVDEATELALKKKRNESLNIIKRYELDQFVEQSLAQGVDFKEVLMGIMVGSEKKFTGSKDSISTRRSGIRNTWESFFQNSLEEIDPSARKLLNSDEEFQKNVFFEVAGEKTDDELAVKVAKSITDLTDMVLSRMNNAGSSIGKLKGWFMQDHDPIRMTSTLEAGSSKADQAWIDFITERIDVKKTFGKIKEEDLPIILKETYSNIVKGSKRKIGENLQVDDLTRNVLNNLENHRILYFKDAQASWEYRQRYSRKGGMDVAIDNYLDSSSRNVALLERAGPSSEYNLKSLIDKEVDRINADKSLTPEERYKKAKKTSQIWDGMLGLGNVYKELDGQTFSPINVSAAKWGAGARALQNISKLGMATVSAFADIPVKAINMRRFNGDNIFSSFNKALRYTLLEGKTDIEKKRTLRRLGAFLDGTLSSVASRLNPEDGKMGTLSRINDKYFRLIGLTQWTGSHKSGNIFFLASELGHNVKKGSLENINKDVRASVKEYGVGAKEWEAFRLMAEDLPDGTTVVAPDKALDLPEEVLIQFIPDSFKSETPPTNFGEGLDPAKVLALYNAERQRQIKLAGFDLENKLMGLYSQETSYSIIEPDEKTRARMVFGTRPGSLSGEIARFVTQFKGFPLAYYQKFIGGKRWKRASLGEGEKDIGGILSTAVSMWMFGYAAMTVKDLLKGREPREIDNWKTATASFLQAGSLGLLGDFLFGKVSRTGNSFLENIAGPTAGSVGQGVLVLQDLVQDPKNVGEDAVRLMASHIPFNTWYTYIAMEYAVYGQIREMLSPGSETRKRRRYKKEYGADYWTPNIIKRGGGFK